MIDLLLPLNLFDPNWSQEHSMMQSITKFSSSLPKKHQLGKLYQYIKEDHLLLHWKRENDQSSLPKRSKTYPIQRDT